MTSTVLANDPSITFSPSGAWKPFSNTSFTTSTEASATYNFTGTSLQVYVHFMEATNKSIIPPNASCFVDNSSCISTEPPKGSNQGRQNALFFQSDQLTYGEHMLHIINNLNSSLILNSFVITSPNSSSSSSVPGNAQSTVSSLDFPSSSQATSAPSSTSSSISSLASQVHKTNVGGVVGGVIAALVVLLAAIIIFISHTRRKKRIAARRATPFIIPTAPSPAYSRRSYLSSSSRPLGNPQPEGMVQVGDQLPSFEDVVPSQNLPGPSGTEKPSRYSVDSLPPTEYGYGQGI